MSTPEGKVKDFIKKFLREHHAHYFMPVQNGMGAPGVDFHCVYYGQAFFIEAKAPGKDLTKRQKQFFKEMTSYGAACFKVADISDLLLVRGWMCRASRTESAKRNGQ